MLKFRPISYNEGDFRAVKLSSAGSDATEGQFCYIASGNVNSITATKVAGAGSYPTILFAGSYLGAGTSLFQYARNKYFPVYKEEADIENVSATITAGEYCIAFQMVPGNMFEVHSDLIDCLAIASFETYGQLVNMSTVGKYTVKGQSSAVGDDSGVTIGECVGTLNSTWLRVRVI